MNENDVIEIEKTDNKEIRCLNCGTLLKEDEEFCNKCGMKKGNRKILLCEKCNTEIQAGQKFCHKCGEKIKIDKKEYFDSVKNNFSKKLKSSKKKSKKILIVSIILLIIIALCYLISSIVFVDYHKYTEVGDYKKAYDVANKENKEKIFWENVIFYMSKEIRSNYKDPSSFELREVYIDKESNEIVFKTGGKNSYGGTVLGWDYIKFDEDENKFILWCSLSSLDDEKTYSWDDSSEKLEKALKNLARYSVKEIINHESLMIDIEIIDNVNNLFKTDNYKSANLLDDNVTNLYINISETNA